MDLTEINLPEQLDIAALAALKEELVNAASSSGSLRIDGAAVERVSTPAVQLLLAAARAIEADGRTIRLESPSQTLSAAFQDLGLEQEFRKWSAN